MIQNKHISNEKILYYCTVYFEQKEGPSIHGKLFITYDTIYFVSTDKKSNVTINYTDYAQSDSYFKGRILFPRYEVIKIYISKKWFINKIKFIMKDNSEFIFNRGVLSFSRFKKILKGYTTSYNYLDEI